MQKSIQIIFLSFVIWLINTSFSFDDISELPMRKISKSIEKTWKTEAFSLLKMDVDNACFTNGLFMKVMLKENILGYMYSGRVNSCKSGGCSVDSNLELSFEYFDYYVLLDTNKTLVLLKIYNYQATQGHEVMSRAWLNQFRGLKHGETLVLGRDVEAISGATVSATKLIEDVQQILLCI